MYPGISPSILHRGIRDSWDINTQKVYRNNEEYEELLARIKSILEVIRKVVNEADKTMCARMSDMLMEFEA